MHRSRTSKKFPSHGIKESTLCSTNAVMLCDDYDTITQSKKKVINKPIPIWFFHCTFIASPKVPLPNISPSLISSKSIWSKSSLERGGVKLSGISKGLADLSPISSLDCAAEFRVQSIRSPAVIKWLCGCALLDMENLESGIAVDCVSCDRSFLKALFPTIVEREAEPRGIVESSKETLTFRDNRWENFAEDGASSKNVAVSPSRRAEFCDEEVEILEEEECEEDADEEEFESEYKEKGSPDFTSEELFFTILFIIIAARLNEDNERDSDFCGMLSISSSNGSKGGVRWNKNSPSCSSKASKSFRRAVSFVALRLISWDFNLFKSRGAPSVEEPIFDESDGVGFSSIKASENSVLVVPRTLPGPSCKIFEAFFPNVPKFDTRFEIVSFLFLGPSEVGSNIIPNESLGRGKRSVRGRDNDHVDSVGREKNRRKYDSDERMASEKWMERWNKRLPMKVERNGFHWAQICKCAQHIGGMVDRNATKR